jgi:putative transposase
LTGSRFAWQEGYGAFSYGKNQLIAFIHHIENQEQHHQTRTFPEEYRRFLDILSINYEEQIPISTP